jgi:hypothetical protein
MFQPDILVFFCDSIWDLLLIESFNLLSLLILVNYVSSFCSQLVSIWTVNNILSSYTIGTDINFC